MRIEFSSKSKKQLRDLNLRFQEKIIDSLEKLENGEKIDIKKLKGRKEEYRIRVGNYRVILNRVKEKEFLVTKIGARENIYLLFL
jgi:mRNA interferase RelE/StbE